MDKVVGGAVVGSPGGNLTLALSLERRGDMIGLDWTGYNKTLQLLLPSPFQGEGPGVRFPPDPGYRANPAIVAVAQVVTGVAQVVTSSVS
jgi:hypothetical protein